MKIQWKNAIHLNSSSTNRPTFRWQWSSGHHPNCSWIRFLNTICHCEYLIEVVGCSPVRWKMLSFSTGPSTSELLKHLGSIEARREQKELLASLSKAIRKSDIIGVRALVLYPGCILMLIHNIVLIAAHWLRVVVRRISMAFIICILGAGFRISAINCITEKTQARV